MEFVDHCEITQVHQGAVDQVRQVLPPDEVLSDLADLFKIFGDSTRIKILYALLRSELCVCDIADLLGLTQSAISHQLRVLRSSKLVKFRRDGKTLYYSLADEHVCRIISQGMEHVEEGAVAFFHCGSRLPMPWPKRGTAGRWRRRPPCQPAAPFWRGRCLPPTVFRPVQLYPGGLGGNETMTHQKF